MEMEEKALYSAPSNELLLGLQERVKSGGREMEGQGSASTFVHVHRATAEGGDL